MEWMHHRHLVQEVEASLHDEIRELGRALQNPSTFEAAGFAKDVGVLKEIIRITMQPEKQPEINFHIRGFTT